MRPNVLRIYLALEKEEVGRWKKKKKKGVPGHLHSGLDQERYVVTINNQKSEVEQRVLWLWTLTATLDSNAVA
jgi:hypothetical protein